MRENVTADELKTMEDLMHTKVDIIAGYIEDKKYDCAMIELGALNEYIRLQTNKAMTLIPNNML